MSKTTDCSVRSRWSNYVYRARRSPWRPTLHLSKQQKHPDFSGPCSNFSTQTWAFRLARQWCTSNQSILLCTVRRCPVGDQLHTWNKWPQGLPIASRFVLLLSVHCCSISFFASRLQLHWIAGRRYAQTSELGRLSTGRGGLPLEPKQTIMLTLSNHIKKICRPLKAMIDIWYQKRQLFLGWNQGKLELLLKQSQMQKYTRTKALKPKKYPNNYPPHLKYLSWQHNTNHLSSQQKH